MKEGRPSNGLKALQKTLDKRLDGQPHDFSREKDLNYPPMLRVVVGKYGESQTLYVNGS